MKKFFMVLVILLVAGLMITCDTGGNWNVMELPVLPIIFDAGYLLAPGVTIGEAYGNNQYQFTTPYDASKYNAVIIEYKKDVYWADGEIEGSAGKVYTCDWSGKPYDGDKIRLVLPFTDDSKAIAITAITVSPFANVQKAYFAKIDD